MKKLFLGLTLSILTVNLLPKMDMTPDTIPHTFCFEDGNCYQGSNTGDDTTVINPKTGNIITQESRLLACFNGICYNLNEEGFITSQFLQTK